mmetsp:Transcript_33722/g.95411  ORF Transcript_33722/g.95411 Transcript_33722/m.95411 type:complete len:201 (+) Transcript_33722:497-1099(+)
MERCDRAVWAALCLCSHGGACRGSHVRHCDWGGPAGSPLACAAVCSGQRCRVKRNRCAWKICRLHPNSVWAADGVHPGWNRQPNHRAAGGGRHLPDHTGTGDRPHCRSELELFHSPPRQRAHARQPRHRSQPEKQHYCGHVRGDAEVHGGLVSRNCLRRHEGRHSVHTGQPPVHSRPADCVRCPRQDHRHPCGGRGPNEA